MFQPQPTPFAYFQTTYGVGNANIPEYTFAPTPLGQGGGSGGRATSSDGLPPLGPNVNNVFTSPAFDNSLLANNHPHQLPYNSIPHHQHGIRPRDHHHSGHGRRIKMEQQSDLAQQEAAAREFKPQLSGPMVGVKITSHAITEEYAKADPVYVAKTLALPRTYSHYRPIQGDGNCGWRAIFFGYFECLIRCADISRIQTELARLNSLNDYIANVGGYELDMFDYMIEETFETMNGIIQAMNSGQDPMEILTQKFNDETSASPMIYHLRLLAASCLKEHYDDEYAPFCDVSPNASSYCDSWILPVDREIDHLGLILLFRVLLEPANIVLEIAYLDRSEGDQVNVHRMPEEANRKDPAALGSMIHLLYRPGHYDILYRDTVVPPPPKSLQVNRVTSLSHQHEIQNTIPSLQTFSTLDLSTLAMIPGFDAPIMSPLASPPATSPMTEGYSQSPQSPWISNFSDGLPASTATAVPPPPAPPQQQPSPPQQPLTQQPLVPPTQHRLRFSKYNFPDLPEMVGANTYATEPTFTTNTFKNSHFNVAHYNNPHFQPEEYKPDHDDEFPTASRIGARKRSHENCGGGIKKECKG
ncbi:peptidase C65 Otubain-domain-containing protein [Pseudomassariella vexata]|uniref:ubiquitinyl hydrolase 1 n=1 Tax=Pseudomassariella vexata TaxID=1141098 RepID=A0A1Y2E893_9PEZI|nr:peptidase C65 Otubain-domain-containing protein [Pseudomassariella vexata]ORY67759.1 peptidase C65 Otubain-domain-containing protein [Pseudomassariella vexata]